MSEVTCTYVPERPVALRGVKSKQSVLVQIQTGAAPEREMLAPLHVAIVLDRSGSMSGSKLKNSKRAIRKIIKHLTPRDKLHCITYDTVVQQVFFDGNLNDKDALEDQVRAIHAGSSTNLHAGLVAGAEALLQDTGTYAVPPVKRIFLFSDGLANHGITAPSAILAKVDQYVARGVTISSFGVGADFDEELMRSIATRGQGRFFFIDSGPNIPRIVSESIHGLISVAGTGARLFVRGLNGSIVTRVHGADTDDLMQGMSIGDLHYANLKNILVDVDIMPQAEPHGVVMEFALMYQTTSHRVTSDVAAAAAAPTAEDEAAAAAAPVARLASGESVSIKGVVELDFTDDWTAAPPANDQVAVACAIQRSADLDDEVAALLEAQSHDAAVAKKHESIALLEAVAAQDTSGQVANILLRARQTLERLEANAGAAETRLAVAYECSLQRAMSCEALVQRQDSDEDRWSNDGGSRSGSPVMGVPRMGSNSPPLYHVQRMHSDPMDFDSDSDEEAGLQRAATPSPPPPPPPPPPRSMWRLWSRLVGW